MGSALITRRGGGKPEGLYAWKKYSIDAVDSVHTSETKVNTILGNTSGSWSSFKYADSYHVENDVFVLDNPKTINLTTDTLPTSGYVVTDEYKLQGSSGTSFEPLFRGKYLHVIKSITYANSDSNPWVMNGEYEYHTIETVSTFLDYIVSDKETAYPDGGEKGGYWYEKVGDDILTPEMFGLTKMAVDKYTPTAEGNLMTIPHSLGEKPKIAILIADKNDVGYYLSSNGTYVYVFFAYMSHMSDNTYPYGYDEGLYTNGTKRYGKLNPIASGSGTDKSSLNETKAIFVFQYTNTTYTYYGYYKKGVEYTLITMA